MHPDTEAVAAARQRQPPRLSRRSLLVGVGTTSALMTTPRWARAVQQPEVEIDAPTDGRDATEVIMRQIAAAPDGALIRFPVGRSSGRYRADGRLWIQERRGLTIVGPGAADPATVWTDRVGQEIGVTNRRGYSARNHWSFRRCDNIVVQNLRVEGPNNTRDPEGYPHLTRVYEGEHAFSFNMSSNCLLLDCSADSVFGDGCWVHGPAGHKATNITIRRFSTTSNGRHGLGLFNVDGVVVDGLNVVKGGTVGVDMEPNGPDESTLNIELGNCRIDTRTVAFSAFGAREVSNVWLHHSTVVHANTWPLLGVRRRDGGRSHDWRVEDNTGEFESVATRGLNFVRVENVIVRGNRIRLASRGDRTGVSLQDCRGQLEVVDNDFTGASAAFVSEGSTGEVISSGNRCRGCAEGQSPGKKRPSIKERPPSEKREATSESPSAGGSAAGPTDASEGGPASQPPSPAQSAERAPAAPPDIMAEATAAAMTIGTLAASAAGVAVRDRVRGRRRQDLQQPRDPPPGADD